MKLGPLTLFVCAKFTFLYTFFFKNKVQIKYPRPVCSCGALDLLIFPLPACQQCGWCKVYAVSTTQDIDVKDTPIMMKPATGVTPEKLGFQPQPHTIPKLAQKFRIKIKLEKKNQLSFDDLGMAFPALISRQCLFPSYTLTW